MVFGVRQLTANRKWRKPLLWRHPLQPGRAVCEWGIAHPSTAPLAELLASIPEVGRDDDFEHEPHGERQMYLVDTAGYLFG